MAHTSSPIPSAANIWVKKSVIPALWSEPLTMATGRANAQRPTMRQARFLSVSPQPSDNAPADRSRRAPGAHRGSGLQIAEDGEHSSVVSL
jgi:hypothetical protein